jgi:glycosyltransferase involved in cell wall biosynthesis
MMFDVIIPTIDRETLDRAVESVIAQTYQDWRLQLVFHGVPTRHFDDYRVRSWYVPKDQPDYGASARNFGYARGVAPCIAYLDDDDIWHPNHLETIHKLIESDPYANMFKTAAQEMRVRHDRLTRNRIRFRTVNSTDPLTITIAHSRSLFLRTQGWQPVDNHDHLLWKEMLDSGGTPLYSDEVTAAFAR